jgi:hypothetical protein
VIVSDIVSNNAEFDVDDKDEQRISHIIMNSISETKDKPFAILVNRDLVNEVWRYIKILKDMHQFGTYPAARNFFKSGKIPKKDMENLIKNNIVPFK